MVNKLLSSGPDRRGSLMIKHGGKALHNLIKLVPNSTCQLCYFPNAWKFDNRIYLKKPGKESYHDLKSHTSVSLTSTLGENITENTPFSTTARLSRRNDFFQKKKSTCLQKVS